MGGVSGQNQWLGEEFLNCLKVCVAGTLVNPKSLPSSNDRDLPENRGDLIVWLIK